MNAVVIGRRLRRGFTLMELMVVILIVGILAVIAIPLYDRYIQQTRASEARAMIGAIVAAEKAYAERNGAFIAINTGQEFVDRLKVDVGESDLFDYRVHGVNARDTFIVTATVNTNGEQAGLCAGGSVQYDYDRRRDPNPRGQWTDYSCPEAPPSS